MDELLKLPSGLKLRESTTYGRGVFSESDLAVGTEVLVSQPFLHVVSSDYRGARCDVCLKSSESLQKCSQCKYAYYCGKTCQGKDWSLHKTECKALRSTQPLCFQDVTRLVFRLVQKRKTKDSGREINLLYSNQDSVAGKRQLDMFCSMLEVSALMHKCGWDSMLMYAHEVLYKVVCNKFGISDWNLNIIASGLYLLPSLFNHSCAANCQIVYDGLQLIIRTIKPVKRNDQLFISYTELLEPKKERQSHLSRIYSFQCSCERCLSEDEVATGLLAAASEAIPTSVLKETMEAGCIQLTKIENLRKCNDWKGALELSQHLIVQYKPTLSIHNFVVVRLVREIVESSMKLERLSETLESAIQLLELYRHHFPDFDINTTLLLCNIAEIRQRIAIKYQSWEEVELAICDLSQAQELLRVSHGVNHSLTIYVDSQLRDLVSFKRELVARRRQAKS